MNRPTKDHMDTVYRVLRYLKGNPGKRLFFKRSSIRDIKVYSEVDWARSHPTQIDVLLQGIVHLYICVGNLVTWRSKKQFVVARSSAEAEYRALAHGICKGMWLKQLLAELKFEDGRPVEVRCDNQATISIAKILFTMIGQSMLKWIDIL